MGAFFLYQRNAELFTDEVKPSSAKKGLARRAVSNWASGLLCFIRRCCRIRQFLFRENGAGVFSCGTIVYRGLGYRESLRRILEDFVGGNLDQMQALGNFCLFFWDGKEVSLLTDRRTPSTSLSMRIAIACRRRF
jgi:hypothetical protein